MTTNTSFRLNTPKVIDEPDRHNEHDQVVTRRIRFGSICPIKGLEPLPCLFHCYGRLA